MGHLSHLWRRLSGTLQKAARASRIEGNRPSKDGALTLHMSNSFHPDIDSRFIKQVRKLRWSVAFVILQNCDSMTLVPQGQCAAKQPLTKIQFASILNCRQLLALLVREGPQ